MDEIKVKEEVRKLYAQAALSEGAGCCSGSSCCSDGAPVSLVDYGVLNADLPEGANLGLGCGVPTLQADIRSGETVLDLGSGAGIDAFLAAKSVGEEGRVIGVDMTPEMIARAREIARRGGSKNVEFRLGEIEHLPVESGTIDVALSNCVINLVPDKRLVYLELYRVLKSGGRFSISDIVTFGEVPDAVRKDLDLWAGCVAGAMDEQEYLELIRSAGFRDVAVKQRSLMPQEGDPSYGMASVTIEGFKG